jgi:hypothetical protein
MSGTKADAWTPETTAEIARKPLTRPRVVRNSHTKPHTGTKPKTTIRIRPLIALPRPINDETNRFQFIVINDEFSF